MTAINKIIRIIAAMSEEEKRELRDTFFMEQKHPGEDWLPTAEGINSLPKGMKTYIYHLETNADPAGMVRENILAKDLILQLEAKIAAHQTIKPAWIEQFFEASEDFYKDGDYIDGYLSFHSLADFLNRKIKEEKT